MEKVVEIVEELATKYSSDIERATRLAEAEVRKLKEFKEFEKQLVTNAIRDMVYDARCRLSKIIRRSKLGSNVYKAKPKVVVAASLGVRRAAETWYNLPIAGTTLGRLKGAELAKIAASEEAVGNGHIFNCWLLLALEPLVPPNKTVKQSVADHKISSIATKIKRNMAAA